MDLEVNFDEHFVVLGGRFLDLFELENLRGSIFFTDNRFHLGILHYV